MDKKKIYLAGGIQNLSYAEANDWRVSLQYILTQRELPYKCFNPLKYLVEDDVEFDLNALRHSDLVVVNFNDPKSLGTMAEIAIAYEHRIPIIGYCPSGATELLHPWIKYMINEICVDLDDLIDIITNYNY